MMRSDWVTTPRTAIAHPDAEDQTTSPSTTTPAARKAARPPLEPRREGPEDHRHHGGEQQRQHDRAHGGRGPHEDGAEADDPEHRPRGQPHPVEQRTVRPPSPSATSHRGRSGAPPPRPAASPTASATGGSPAALAGPSSGVGSSAGTAQVWAHRRPRSGHGSAPAMLRAWGRGRMPSPGSRHAVDLPGAPGAGPAVEAVATAPSSTALRCAWALRRQTSRTRWGRGWAARATPRSASPCGRSPARSSSVQRCGGGWRQGCSRSCPMAARCACGPTACSGHGGRGRGHPAERAGRQPQPCPHRRLHA